MAVGCVYLITNTVNGKRYVGHTVQDDAGTLRLQSHFRSARLGVKLPLTNAIRRYGEDSFTVEAVATARAKAQLEELEGQAIEHYDTLTPRGYNATKGGPGALGYKHSAKTRAKMATSMRKAWANEVVRARINSAQKSAKRQPRRQTNSGRPHKDVSPRATLRRKWVERQLAEMAAQGITGLSPDRWHAYKMGRRPLPPGISPADRSHE